MPDKVDVVSAARFTLSVDGLPKMEFSELTGISMEIDVVEFQDNNAEGKVTLHKLPGKMKPPTIGLKRPMNSVIGLWEWHEALALGGYNVSRRNGNLTMHDFEGTPVASYEFLGAWPSKVNLGGLKAGQSEVLIEEVTITCEMLKRVPV